MRSITADAAGHQADIHATKLYFMARRAGWRPAQAIGGYISFYDMKDGRYPGMNREVYGNPWHTWPYDAWR